MGTVPIDIRVVLESTVHASALVVVARDNLSLIVWR
jgi:hypothetical protein